jgi:hypothetical protein
MNDDNPKTGNQVAGERALDEATPRREAMTAFAGAWKDRPEFDDPEAYIHSLRQGRRLQQLRGVWWS